jgi:hypothetical protein
LVALGGVTSAAPPFATRARDLPAIVFVARQPAPGVTQIPGLGPHGRTLAVPGGRLLVRERNGTLRDLLPPGRFCDVADPSVDFDGRRIAFAACESCSGPWRIWRVDADGSDLQPVTRDDRAIDLAAARLDSLRFARYDDFDPTWLPDGRICFASTRFPQRAQPSDVAVSNLYVTGRAGAPPLRITAERNGGEEPSFDPSDGRILYARWWFNRYLPSDAAPAAGLPVGVTLDAAVAVPQDTIDLWAAGSILADGDAIKLGAGDPRVRADMRAYQPVRLAGKAAGRRPATGSTGGHGESSAAGGGSGEPGGGGRHANARTDPGDGPGAHRGRAGSFSTLGKNSFAGAGDVVAVYAEPASMSPAPLRTGLVRFHDGIGDATYLTGPGTGFPGSACAPAALADGRILFAGDGQGRGDFGVFIFDAQGKRIARVVDQDGVHELDPVPLVARRDARAAHEEFTDLPSPLVPHMQPEQVADPSYTFRFDCLNVFAQGDVDAPLPNAPAARQDLRIRFYAALARPERAGGDSLVLLREVPIDPSGAIHVDDIIAETPVFEQLVDGEGRVLRAHRGPTHVAGFNFSRMGSGTKCIGCHTGHSALPPPTNNWRALWFNAAPSARVWASSHAGGQPSQLVDRRARGRASEVGWIAAGPDSQRVRLSWQLPIEVRAVVLYAVESEPQAGTQLRIQETDLVFFRDDVEVKRLHVRRTLSPKGTRVDCEPVRVSAIEVVPTRTSGIVERRAAVALAEIETIARLIED